MSDHDGLFSRWVDLLDKSVGVFDQTVASLQYVLEEHLENTWQAVARCGDEELLVCSKQLSGEGGLLDRERRRVKVQEELLALDEDVAKARDFAEKIAEADELAEEQIGRMCAWMTRGELQTRGGSAKAIQAGLHFGARRAWRPHPGGRKTFIEGCITGIDPESGNPPYTAPMSFSRQQVSAKAGVYPFRYGQPFVDSIYQLAIGDSRGATCAFLRVLNSSALQAPKVFFHFKWLVTAAELGCTYQEQMIADELLTPTVQGHWLAEDGSLVTAESTLKSLDWPYKKPAGGISRDINLRHDVWSELEFLLPAGEWERLVLSITELSRKRIVDEVGVLRDSVLEPQLHLLAVRAQIICPKDLWSKS